MVRNNCIMKYFDYKCCVIYMVTYYFSHLAYEFIRQDLSKGEKVNPGFESLRIFSKALSSALFSHVIYIYMKRSSMWET